MASDFGSSVDDHTPLNNLLNRAAVSLLGPGHDYEDYLNSDAHTPNQMLKRIEQYVEKTRPVDEGNTGG